MRHLVATQTQLRLTAAAVLLAAFFCNAAAAQAPAGMSVLARYAPILLKPEVVGGRIVGRSYRDAYPQINAGGERLSVQAATEPGELEMVYDGVLRSGPFRGKKLAILLDTTGRLEINRGDEASQADACMSFIQKPAESIVFTLGRSAAGREMHAGTIWELLIAYPQECQQHLLPILYTLRPGWNLMFTAEQVKSNLLQLSATGSDSQDALWHELVEQLGHASYASREAADRRLRESGRAAVAYLKKLDISRLDAEQRLRVSRILRDLADGEPTTREIAEELFGDPLVWLAVARSGEESERQTAKNELEKLLKTDVAFEPAAPPPVRLQQLQELESKTRKK